MKEFFGIGGYARAPEGYMSFGHLFFVTALMAVTAASAVILGRRYRSRPRRDKKRVLAVAAFLIDGLELFKIVFLCFREHNPMQWLYLLPLFLCSIQLITIPMAAFGKGRFEEAALDFVLIFGLLGALLGTYGAGQNYAAYPVLSFDNVVSGLTHAISGFCAIYIGVSGLCSLKKKNVPVTFAILSGFCLSAYIADVLIPYNYMFLIRGDGTPYDVVYGLTGGSPVFYPLTVYGLFLVYIAVFYLITNIIKRRKTTQKGAPRHGT